MIFSGIHLTGRVSVPPIPPPLHTYATWGTTSNSHTILSNGNLTAKRDLSASDTGSVMANMGKSSGKWYWEITKSNAGAPVHNWVGANIGAASVIPPDHSLGNAANAFAWYTAPAYNYFKKNGAIGAVLGTTLPNGATVGLALDMDAKTVTYYNASGVVGTLTGLTGTTVYPAVGLYYTNEGVIANFGQSGFVYAVPNGFNPGVYTTP